MTAAKRDIVIEKGATFRLNLVLTDSAGVLMNLTGYVGRMQVRETMETEVPALDLAGTDFTFTVDGRCRVKASATLTTALTIAQGVYDLEIESPTGEVDRLLEGKAKVKPNVTRPAATAP